MITMNEVLIDSFFFFFFLLFFKENLSSWDKQFSTGSAGQVCALSASEFPFLQPQIERLDVLDVLSVQADHQVL